MSNLPILQSGDTNLTLMQNKWSAILNPVVANPSSNVSILKNVLLTTGSNTINHLLGRNILGWRLVRLRGLASIYDQQDTNPRPSLTLVLISNADVSADIEVF